MRGMEDLVRRRVAVGRHARGIPSSYCKGKDKDGKGQEKNYFKVPGYSTGQ